MQEDKRLVFVSHISQDEEVRFGKGKNNRTIVGLVSRVGGR
jgi:hypothetical protein